MDIAPTRVAACPPLVTTTSAAPAPCAAVEQVSEVVDDTTTEVQGCPPTVTVLPPPKCDPVTTTTVPPAVDPAEGLIAFTVGTGAAEKTMVTVPVEPAGAKPAAPCARDAPPALSDGAQLTALTALEE